MAVVLNELKNLLETLQINQSINQSLFIHCRLPFKYKTKAKKHKIIEILSNTTTGLQRKTIKGHLVSHNPNFIFKLKKNFNYNYRKKKNNEKKKHRPKQIIIIIINKKKKAIQILYFTIYINT